MPLTARQNVEVFDLPEQEDLEPSGYLRISSSELSDEKKRDLEDYVCGHLQQIEEQMGDVLERFESERNRFDGTFTAPDFPYRGAFRANYPVTKRKSREVCNKIKAAFIDSKPRWSISSDRLKTTNVQDIEDYIESKWDYEIHSENDFAQCAFQATLHGTGILVPDWVYIEESQRDVESFSGFDGETFQSLKGMAEFEKLYPDWKEEDSLRKIHRKLENGEDVKLEFSYTTPVQSNPKLTFVSCTDARVYPSVNGFQGLRTTPVYGYIRQFTRAELERLVNDGFIEDDWFQDVLSDRGKAEDSSSKETAKSETDEFDIFIATVRTDVVSGEYERFKVWFDTDTEKIIRVQHFPWWYAAPDLIPHYIRHEEPGFFKPGIAEDLKDDHMLLVVILNMFLNGMSMANSLNLKVKLNSPAHKHILARKYSPHVPTPFEQDGNEVQPMQFPVHQLSSNLEAFELMRRQSDESTQTSALQSGRESPTDPEAPAAKTALLLKQVAPNMREYIRSMQEGFQEDGRWLLWMYYQGTKLDWLLDGQGFPISNTNQFREIVGSLSPRAIAFENDAAQQDQINLMVLKLVKETFPNNQSLVSEVAKVTIGQLSGDWSKRVEELPFDQGMQPLQPGMQQPGMPGGGQPGIPQSGVPAIPLQRPSVPKPNAMNVSQRQGPPQ